MFMYYFFIVFKIVFILEDVIRVNCDLINWWIVVNMILFCMMYFDLGVF